MGKKTTKWTLETVKAFYANYGCTFISKEYKTMLDKYTFICKCGNEHTSSFESFHKHSKRCKVCTSKEMSERRRLKKPVIIKNLEAKGFTYLAHYWDKKETAETDRNWLLVDYICKNGHIHRGKHYSSTVRAEYACMECIANQLGDLQRLSVEQVSAIVSAQGMELLSKSYVNNASPIEVRCVCGEPYTTTLMSVSHGHKCGCHRRGEHHYNYNPNLTEEERQDKRMYPEYYQWVRDVYLRDDFTCQKCKKRGGELHAHHIFSYAKYKDKRTDIANGVTLCKADHIDFHKQYGLRDFTQEDFFKFMGYIS
ncbi:putative HNH endonuclease [Bacillus phage vB_BmeM-Goe8]|uniref:Putative HNH endonuclease n=1 Tax=Bacillus phage vB_BmeM-Goe8 TaxID=2593638 RepID=A0A516KMS6_9CAUD|nr:putative HNH endonuclease [Bacillus phage vB_BmeM-Goe8]QDP42880.1 putative HNH endonuclease [Bacillus phage vB_BmeM-Goe8]